MHPHAALAASGAGGPFMAITETDCPVCAQIGATAQSLGSEGGF